MLRVEQVGDQIELVDADNGIGMKDKDSAKIPEKRGSDYVAIFVRQLGGAIVSSKQESTERPCEYGYPCCWSRRAAPSEWPPKIFAGGSTAKEIGAYAIE
jgi:hypothetical protein